MTMKLLFYSGLGELKCHHVVISMLVKILQTHSSSLLNVD